jgi:hypothetical protein
MGFTQIVQIAAVQMDLAWQFTYLKLGRFSDGEEVEEARDKVSVNNLLNGWVSLLGKESSESNCGKNYLCLTRLIDQVIELLEIVLL